MGASMKPINALWEWLGPTRRLVLNAWLLGAVMVSGAYAAADGKWFWAVFALIPVLLGFHFIGEGIEEVERETHTD